MEKRFILAVTLSFAFLYVWGLFTKTPQSTPLEIDKGSVVAEAPSQPEISQDIQETAAKKDEKIPKNTEVIENKEFTLETDVLEVSFVDLGAAIKSIFIKTHGATLPITNLNQIQMFSNDRFVVSEQSDTHIVFTRDAGDYRVEQEYEINGNGYTLNTSTTITNISKMSKLISPKFLGYEVDSSSLDINGNDMVLMRDKTLYEYAIKHGKKVHRASKAYAFTEKKNKEILDGEVDWVAFRDRYFSAITKPQFTANTTRLTPDMRSEFLIEEKGFFGSKTKSTHLDVSMEAEEIELKPGEKASFNFVSYIGPEEMSKLKPMGLGFEKVKRYYRFGLFDFAGKLINQIFHLMYKIIPNWGLCIILLSVIVYFSMYPLTKKSMTSMRKMQAIAPKINALKAKYKDDPQTLNAKTLEIYQKEKINPAGGCLPIILQMPIFLGLYQVLWRSVSIKGSNFLWINDLTEPDRLMIFPFSLPVIGNELNILPLLMIVIMFFQQRFSMRNITPADPMQAQQQKMMSVMMPFLIGFIFYKFSSGLTLYFTLFYIFSTVTQWKMSKQAKVE